MSASTSRFGGRNGLAALLFASLLGLGLLGVDVRSAGAQAQWGDAVMRHDPAWYGSAEARAMADSVLLYQSPQGGWPKSTNLAVPPRTPEDVPPPGRGRANSFDNDATTLPMEFLARMVTSTGEERYRHAFSRGLEYLFEAQYPSGGWPQFYPLREGYYSNITFNDDAMVRVLNILRDVSRGQAPYGFVETSTRARAAAAVERGVDLILKTQVQQNGTLTGWCAQYDPQTLKPAWARAYEPPSLSGNETVGILGFLMSLEQPDPRVVAAIEGGTEWLRSVAIQGLRVDNVTNAQGEPDRVVVADPSAPLLWARFYELVTDRPLFLGRSSVYHYSFSEIEAERRAGYGYYGTWPETLLERTYPDWKARLARTGMASPAPAS